MIIRPVVLIATSHVQVPTQTLPQTSLSKMNRSSANALSLCVVHQRDAGSNVDHLLQGLDPALVPASPFAASYQPA